MSILDAYDPAREAVLEPSHAAAPVEGFPETVVVTFQPSLTQAAANWPGTRVLGHLPVFFQIPIYAIDYQGKTFGLYQTLLGSAASAGMMEEVIARGSRRFILFGSCGSLTRDLPDGHLIVPTAARRDEGVSYHYLPPEEDYIALDTAPRTAQVLTELGVPFVEGRTWTTDALYRETRRNVARRQTEGCLCVDMECAACAAVCQFRGVEFYQFLYTEDNLGGDFWDPGLLGKLPQDAKEAYFRLALELARRVTP